MLSVSGITCIALVALRTMCFEPQLPGYKSPMVQITCIDDDALAAQLAVPTCESLGYGEIKP